MNALMVIQIKVMTQQALAEYAKVSAADRAFMNQMARSNAMAAGLGARSGALAKWGSQLQWAGRQLTYNFTMPLAIAGGAATKWALDNEASMVRIKKVYGDGVRDAQFYAKEIVSLGKAFEALSNQYGVQRSAVQNIAADWAAAGSSGLALAKSTKLTLDTMILGEMDAADATQALISIQAQFGQSTTELSKTIDTLNMIENQTGISMAGLIQGFQRSAGVARSAGIDVNHLGAMLAALVPASGGAEQAGNAVKTMISRLLSPTKEAAQVLGLMGTNVKDLGWNSLNGAQRLETLAKKFNTLDDAQKAVVASTIASRWQINKFDVLMRDIASGTGYYAKALASTADETVNFQQKTKELNAVLDSNPQKLKQIGVILQNSLVDVVQPLIPYIVSLGTTIAHLAQDFQNINPAIQKLLLTLAGLLLIAGPILKYLGSIATLIGYVGMTAAKAGSGLFWLAGGIFKIATAPFKLIWAGLTGIGNGAVFMVTKILAVTKLGAAFSWLGAQFGLLRIMASLAWADLVVDAKVAMRNLMRVMWAGLVTQMGALVGPMTMLWANLRVAAAVGATNLSLVFAVGMTKARIMAMAALSPLMGWMDKFLVALVTKMGALPIIWAQIQGTMMALWSSFQVGFAAVFASGAGRMTALMSELGYILTNIQIVWQRGLLALQTAWNTAMVTLWGWWTSTVATIQAGAGAALTRIWAAMQVAMVSLQTAWNGVIVTLWEAWTTAVAAIQTFAAGLLPRIWAAMQAAMLATQAAFNTAMTTLWGWLMAGMNATVAGGLTALRAVWAATMAFLTSPGMLITGLRSLALVIIDAFVAVGPAIMGFFTSIGPTLLSILSGVGSALVAVFTSPWTIAALAVLGVVYAFRDDIANIWNSIVAYFGNGALQQAFAPLVDFFNQVSAGIQAAFNRLPAGVQGAFQAVVDIVYNAAMQVYDLFSYFNPFAHHSPSLVENVTKGMAVVAKQYQTISNPGLFARAIADVTAYKKAMADLGQGGFGDQRNNVSKGLPAMLPLFDRLIVDLKQLNVVLAQQKAAVDAQQAVVDKWKNALDAANAALDREQKGLDAAQGNLDALNASYDAHSQALQNYANAPIKGMGEMNDAIFANDQAQKALQLQLLKLGDGGNIDKMREKFSKLQGDVEMLNGQKNDLRMAGAGSDITSVYDKQISAAQAQQKAVEDQMVPVQALNDQLAALQHQAEIMDLEKSLKFDPLTHQIEKLTNTTKELTFEEITAGIAKEQDAMKKLAPQIDSATKDVAKHKAAVDAATKARDAISATYDRENAKLTALNDEYSKTEQAIRDIESALNDMGAAGNDAVQKLKAHAAKKPKGHKAPKAPALSPGAQNFLDAKGGNFPDVGGKARIGREGGIGDQSKAIDDWIAQQPKDIAASFGKIDMFKPFKDMWNSAWKWVETNVAPWVTKAVDAIKATWNNLFGGVDLAGGAKKKFSGIFDGASNALSTAWGAIKKVIDLFAPDFKRIWDEIVKGAGRVWNEVGPEVAKFGKIFKNLGPAFKGLWNFIKPVVMLLGGALLGALKMVTSIIGHTVGPIINFLIDSFKNIIKVVRGVVEVVVGVFSGDWKMAWQGIVDIVSGTFGQIWNIIKSAGAIIWGVVKGIVGGIVGFFKWLWDVLVGHSIIPDTINAIVKWFKDLGPWALKHIQDFVTNAVEWFKKLPGKTWDAMKNLGTKIADIATKAWTAFSDACTTAWKKVTTWLGGLGKKVWDSLKDIITKMGKLGKDALKELWDREISGWKNIIDWLKKLPGKAWDAIKELVTKMGNAGKNAFKAMSDKMSAIWNGTSGIQKWISKLPQRAWDAIKDIATKLGTIGKTAMKNLSTNMSNIWNGKTGIQQWLKGLPQRAWDAIKAIGDKLGTIGKTAMHNMSTNMSNIWNGKTGIQQWIANLPGRAWDAIKTLSTKLGDAGKAAFKALWTAMSNVWNGKTGIQQWIANLPGRIAKALGSIGTVVANAVKASWNTAAGWINDHGIANINKVTGKLGFTMGSLPTFATGGIVPGGHSKKDNMLIAARSGEGVIVPEAVRALGGAGGIHALNRMAERGGDVFSMLAKRGHAFKDGGVVGAAKGIWGNVKDIGGAIDGWLKKGVGNALSHIMDPLAGALRKFMPGESMMEDFMAGTLSEWAKTARTWGDKKDKDIASSGIGDGSVDRWASTVQAVLADLGEGGHVEKIPGVLRLIKKESGGNPHAINLTDSNAMKGTPSKGLVQVIDPTFASMGPRNGKNKGIWDPYSNIYAGLNWARYKWGSIEAVDPRVHQGGYDQGGWLKPGQTMANNSSGRPEPVFSASQWMILKALVSTSSYIIKSATDASTAAGTGIGGGTLINAQARFARASATDTTKTSNKDGRVININGDLVMPNIRTGDDAKVFIKNLESLAG